MLPSLPEDDDCSTGNDSSDNNRGDNDVLPSEKMMTLKQDPSEEDESIAGVLVGRVVRGYYSTMNLVVVGDTTSAKDSEEEQYHVLVRIQYNDAGNTNGNDSNSTAVKDLRSYFRRYCKNGDLLHIRRGTYQDAAAEQQQNQLEDTTKEEEAEAWRDPRYVVTVYSVEDAQQSIQLLQSKYWGMSQWQGWQEKLYRCEQKQKQYQNKSKNKKQKNESKSTGEQDECCMAHHAGGLEKRQQATMVANFLLNMIMAEMKIKGDNKCTANDEDPTTWSNPPRITTNEEDEVAQRKAAALEYLNGGSGVLDVAGGSGHVSMALGMLGVQSTIVDPREKVGLLPGRDRKMWNRALKKNSAQQATQTDPQQQQQQTDTTQHASSVDQDTAYGTKVSTIMFCQPIKSTPVRPFQTLRSWFGTPPPGVDTDHRNPDNADVPVCDSEHPAVKNCRAIVALHPDEATDAIVDVAVQRKIPLVIVPCCVFCRLFPNRRMPSDRNNHDNGKKLFNESNEQGNHMEGATVSSYQDLLVYLQAKDDNIRSATLPFVGANTVLFRPLIWQEYVVMPSKD